MKSAGREIFVITASKKNVMPLHQVSKRDILRHIYCALYTACTAPFLPSLFSQIEHLIHTHLQFANAPTFEFEKGIETLCNVYSSYIVLLRQCPRARATPRCPERRAREAKQSAQCREKMWNFGMIALRGQKVILRAQNAYSLLLTKTTLQRVALSPYLQAQICR